MEKDQAHDYTDLLLSRITELEVKYPKEVAHTRFFTELANLDDLVFDESALCQDFDNEVNKQEMYDLLCG
jgi:hypothetical protein